MEKLVKHPQFEPQVELLQRLCSEMGALIADSKDVNEARQIRNRMCERLQQECYSSILVQATEAYADQMIEQKWGTTSSGTY